MFWIPIFWKLRKDRQGMASQASRSALSTPSRWRGAYGRAIPWGAPVRYDRISESTSVTARSPGWASLR
ncbi:hypothetical protein KCP73_19225 [Salmonella enterica subsp. enterica]|nr:hypothetical protein KCP73_19225 [Salmonella enterica subsp. enterica]